MADEVTYANAHAQVPPGFMYLRVIDLDTGNEVEKVIEVNTEEGWLRRYKAAPIDTNLAAWPVERVEGRFRIEDMRNAAHG